MAPSSTAHRGKTATTAALRAARRTRPRTLLRRAEDTGVEVKVLVQHSWLTGRVLGCDGLGAILDDGEGHQSLVRPDQGAAVTFPRAQMGDRLHGAPAPTALPAGTSLHPRTSRPVARVRAEL